MLCQESERLGSSVMVASSNCPKWTRCAVCAPLLMKERGGVVKVGLPKKSICHSEKKSPRHRPPPCGSGFSLTNCLSFCNRSAFVCFVRFTSFVHNLYFSSLMTKNWQTFSLLSKVNLGSGSPLDSGNVQKRASLKLLCSFI